MASCHLAVRKTKLEFKGFMSTRKNKNLFAEKYFLLSAYIKRSAFLMLACLIGATPAFSQSEQETEKSATVARQWTDALLFAIRRDLARPTVHARNLHHLSAAMFDAWSLYDPVASSYFISAGSNIPACQVSSAQRETILSTQTATADAQKIALGHAAWILLNHRFENAGRSTQLLARFESVAATQGLDVIDATLTDLDNPAVVGRLVADCVIAQGLQDNSNELNDYANLNYLPSNTPLNPNVPGNPGDVNPNRWQPLQLDTFIDQSGNVTDTPSFLGADWGNLRPFALEATDRTLVTIDDTEVPVWLDPGVPPELTDNSDTNTTYQLGHALVVQWSAHLDASNATMIDISPASVGNLGELSALPDNQADILAEFDAINGSTFGANGHAMNPATGEAYQPNLVPLGDYTRVLAEFWADGPDSETPPGHWFSVYNEAVVSHPDHQTILEGTGEPIDALEYDVMAYLALGGALHDSAISAWSVKRAYDSSRPVTAIRYMASLGQSTDLTAANYSVHGIPLIEGYIESVQADDPLAGDNGVHVGKIKGLAWRGPDFISNTATDAAGVDWILLENWWPYQRPTFVTPPFAGYVSGHSTFSRAAAEVLTALTGDAYFPGGMAEFVAEQNDFLVFEQGPSVEVRLQWATYRDAADQTSLSRIWGGIHPPADDIVGRRMGEVAGLKAWEKAVALKTGEFESGSDEPVISGGSAGSSGSGCSVTRNSNAIDLPFLLLLFAAFWWCRRQVFFLSQVNN